MIDHLLKSLGLAACCTFLVLYAIHAMHAVIVGRIKFEPSQAWIHAKERPYSFLAAVLLDVGLVIICGVGLVVLINKW